MIDAGSNERINMRLPVVPQIHDALRRKIIRNKLAPGSRLSEAEVAIEFAVSRQPVREVFIRLANDGLLDVFPNRGTFVRKISSRAVRDARFVREAIEVEIVKLLADTREAAVSRELELQIALQQRAVESGDPDEFIALDERFHRTLAEAADKAGAWGVIESQKAQMDRVRYLSLVEHNTAQLLEQHSAIVDGISSGDSRAVEEAMRFHLRRILIDLPIIAQQMPEMFEPN